MKMEIFKRLLQMFLALVFLIVGTVFWQDINSKQFSIDSRLSASNKKIELVELSDGIELNDAFPTRDSEALEQDGYKFKIINKDKQETKVKVLFENDVPKNFKKLPYKNIRYQIYKNGKIFINATNMNDDAILFNDSISDSNIYELKFWIDINSTNEIMGSYFNAKIALI